MKSFTKAALIATATLIALPAQADISDMFGRATNPDRSKAAVAPPAGHDSDWWISANGCTYSRAQAPGYAPTWHLVVNGAHAGMTDAHFDCAHMIQGR